MNDERAPKGAQRLHERLTAAVNKYDEEAIERENETNELEMKELSGKKQTTLSLKLRLLR